MRWSRPPLAPDFGLRPTRRARAPFGPAAPPEDLATVLRRSHLPALDGLRAVAVFVVIAYHFFGSPIPGDLGVSAFFVLSGFLITWLLLKEHDTSGTISLRDFYARRVLRIFPAYYFFITVSFLIDYFRGQPWERALGLSGFFYVVNYYNATHGHPPTSIAHAWSLGIEEQFYVLWPLVLLILARRGKARALAVLSVIIVVVAAWRSFLYLGLRVGTPYVYNAFDTRFDNLAVGCFLALCAGQPWFLRFVRLVVRSALLPLATLALLILSRCAISASYHYSIGFTVDAFLVMVLLVQLLLLHRHPLWSWLQHPVARYLGVISYPLYLWHVWGLGVGKWLGMLPAAGQFVVGVLVCIVVASGSYFAIEKPFLALKRRLVSAPAVPARVGAA
jgi:peptidoglycan/LPS O-acetylase OafA/YrhL